MIRLFFISVLFFLFAGNPCADATGNPCADVAGNPCADGRSYVPEVGRISRPEMKVLATEQRQGYECRYVEFSVCGSENEKERIKAYLLVPDGASKRLKCPAVLMLHDHGARFDIGKEKLVRPIDNLLPEGADDHIHHSSMQWADKYFDGVFLADSLAGQGYVVLVADALYWGERSSADAQRWSALNYGRLECPSRKETLKTLKTKVYEGQRAVYDSLMVKNVIWAEKILRDDAASVGLLKSLPYVDKNNIGAFGFSMGAHRCWMLAAFCEDVKCGVALSWMTTLDREAPMTPSDYSMAVMPMREQSDFGDIGKYLVPKPMLFLNGDKDPLFPAEKTQKAFEILQGHYSSHPDCLQTEFFDGGHHCGKAVQARIFQYLDTNLKSRN